MKYNSRTTGSSHSKRHAEYCKPRQSKYKQQLLTFHFNKKTLKLSESGKLAIKDVKLQFCVRGYHSFNSLENDGLNTLIQTFVNIAEKYGVCEVKDLLYSRNTICSFSREKAAEIKRMFELILVEPLEAESVAVTLDLWTSNYNNNSYLNVHAFWIDQSFQIKHQCLANRHFGTERHTAKNIAKTIQNILCEYGIDVSKTTAIQWRAVTFEISHAIGMPKPSHKIVFIQDQFLS